MQPPEVLANMKNLQMVSNRVTIAHAAVSHAIGEYLAFLDGDSDWEDIGQYTEALARCMKESADALLAYMEAAKRLDRSIGHE